MARVSKRGRLKAAKQYLQVRGLYGRNYLVSKYNAFVDRTLGDVKHTVNETPDKLFKRKIKDRKIDIKRDRYELRSIHKQVISGKTSKVMDVTGKKMTSQMIVDSIARETAANFALSTKDARKRLKRMRKFKKNKTT